ncbi:hypothetical protein P691DRAFT_778261 [Macrolepiota fuliginosa MF-IS2]|uniref:TauD/TfdA-like domain-containing protein n=1 Tax=Macrolepiota fuliginosa MF-IS2 TaxID=1400762 RepID=A0A9P5X6T4_9AGAR|nr:hypothetical protein P691DRAFT_778261 [Macrolepiota fuliginosa MF-IS2]
MAIELALLPLSASANPSKFSNFGREVEGLHPGKLTPEQLEDHDVLLFRNVAITPEEQYALPSLLNCNPNPMDTVTARPSQPRH